MHSTTRNAGLSDLVATLQSNHARQLDVVAPAGQIRAENGMLRVTGTAPEITEDGVTSRDGIYRPTRVFDEGISSKLNIPLAYLRTLREQRPDLYDANVNGWLHGYTYTGEPYMTPTGTPDPRSFLLRLFRADETEEGIARAMLSDSYRVIDNLDVLMAALQGIRDAGVDVNITGCDLTDRRMYVRVQAPEIQAYAPELLRGYRSPFTGATGEENPTVFAGFEISNSETGGGAFTIVPRLIVQVCSNGMKLTKDAMRSVHLGGKLEEGIIRWSDETQQRSVDLARAKTADAVRTFLDVDYVTRAVAQLERRASEELESVDRVKDVTKALGMPQEHIDGMLSFFVKGGQMSRAGVANAVTAYSQGVEDADTAAGLEELAVKVLA